MMRFDLTQSRRAKEKSTFLVNDSYGSEGQGPMNRGTVLYDMLVNGSAVLMQVILTTERPIASGLRTFEGTRIQMLGLDMTNKSSLGGEGAASLATMPWADKRVGFDTTSNGREHSI